MKKKITIRPMELWEPGAIENWLEHEAARGWRITACNGWFATFQKTEPRICRVRIQPHGPESREAWLQRIDAYEAMGWDYAMAMEMDYEVYYCDDPAVPELDTDPVAYSWAWEKPLRRSWWGGWLWLVLSLCLPAVFLLGPLFGEPTALELLLNARFSHLYGLLVLTPLLLVMGLRQLVKVSRARKALAAGVIPVSGGSWKRNRSWWRVMILLLLGYWLVYMGDIFWMAGTDNSIIDLPYTDPVTLVEGTDTYDWDIERYVNTDQPLAPKHYVLRFVTEDQKRVENAGVRTTFPFLAKAWYGERQTDFLADWPEADVQRVEDAAFDQAVLLTGGEDTQLFLARTGCRAYALWVNFPTDLDAAMQEAAEILKP